MEQQRPLMLLVNLSKKWQTLALLEGEQVFSCLIFFYHTEYTIQQAPAQAVSISCKPAWWAYEAWAAGSVSMTAVAPAATTEGRKDTLSMPSNSNLVLVAVLGPNSDMICAFDHV